MGIYPLYPEVETALGPTYEFDADAICYLLHGSFRLSSMN